MQTHTMCYTYMYAKIDKIYKDEHTGVVCLGISLHCGNSRKSFLHTGRCSILIMQQYKEAGKFQRIMCMMKMFVQKTGQMIETDKTNQKKT